MRSDSHHQSFDRNVTEHGIVVPTDFISYDTIIEQFEQDIDEPTIQRDALLDSVFELDGMEKEYFRRLILQEGRIDILMRLLGYRVPPHQLLMNTFLTSHQYGMILAPRGSGKSTCCNVCFCILNAIQNRDIRILIVSRTEDQAKSFLSEIKLNLLKPQMVEMFGNLRGEKWDETQADVFGRTRGTKEHTFTIAGADGAVTSKHFDIIICDDIVEDKNSRTEGGRNHLRKFFYRAVFPTLEPKGIMRVIGTRYHPEDIYGYLATEDPLFMYSNMVVPVVINMVTGEAGEFDQDENGKFSVASNIISYDEEGFSLKTILDRRRSMPAVDFECQYQNRVVFMAGDYFKDTWFKYYDEDPFAMRKRLDLAVYIGVDLAISQNDEADEFALVVVGILNRMAECHVLDTYSGRLTFLEQLSCIERYNGLWNPTRMFIESNAYQQALATTARDEFPEIPIQPIWTTKDKPTRATGIQLYYQRGQMFHRKGRMAKLEAQLTGFPDVKLKDMFDALFFAINGATGTHKKKRREKEPGVF